MNWPPINIALLGGTHGNERTGIIVLQQFIHNPDWLKSYSTLSLIPVLANPRAAERNSRYIDCDLNRQFTQSYPPLTNISTALEEARRSGSYEVGRALEIQEQIGAYTQPISFLIDLHSTTSNMGLCLIIPRETPLSIHLCSLVLAEFPDSFVLCENVLPNEDNTSTHLAEEGLVLEIGPVPQGMAQPIPVQILQIAVRLILQALHELIEDHPSTAPPFPPTPELYKNRVVYRWGSSIDYPRDHLGLPRAMIHPDFMGKDGFPLEEGQALFLDAQGNTLRLEASDFIPQDLILALRALRQKNESLVAFFIGEAAYLEKGIAFQVGYAPLYHKSQKT